MRGWLTLIGVIVFLSFILGPRMLIALLIVVVLMAIQGNRAVKFVNKVRAYLTRADHK